MRDRARIAHVEPHDESQAQSHTRLGSERQPRLRVEPESRWSAEPNHGRNGDFSSRPNQKALTRPADEACQYNPIASQGSKTQERRSIERRSLSVLLIALRRVTRWHAKGVEQRPFAFRINKLRATSGEWAGRQCAKGVGRMAPPASRVSESLKKRRKRRLLRVRYAERKGGARPASRSLSRWMLTTGKFIQAKLTAVNTFSKESFPW